MINDGDYSILTIEFLMIYICNCKALFFKKNKQNYHAGKSINLYQSMKINLIVN